MRTITIQQLADALLCTQRNVRDREGRSLPPPLADVEPRTYLLAEVLWLVDGHDRALICRVCDLSVDELKEQLSRVVEPAVSVGYVPGLDDDSN